MTFSRSEPGFALSAAIHFGLLLAMLVAFSQERKFDDAQEAIPVETISDSQFSQIMKGEKTAKEATGKPRVDRVADISEPKPTPPTPEAKHEVPTPPPPLQRQPDPGEAEDKPTPTPPTPPPPPTPPMPPQRPAPPKPAAKAPPQEDKAEPEKDDAEPVKPPVRPKPPEKAEQKPTPPTPPKPEPKPVEAKPAPKTPKLDEVAKLLAESKDKAAAKPKSAPKSGEESNERRTPDLAEISRMLSREAPKALGSVGRELNKTASLGAPNASAAKMSPSLSDALNGWLMERYKSCWFYLPLSNGPKYVPWIRVSYRPDGSLAGEPVLTNPPSDPASRALADSAMRAVRARACNPLKIPARFQPFYEQWKDWKVGFDPVILN